MILRLTWISLLVKTGNISSFCDCIRCNFQPWKSGYILVTFLINLKDNNINIILIQTAIIAQSLITTNSMHVTAEWKAIPYQLLQCEPQDKRQNLHL